MKKLKHSAIAVIALATLLLAVTACIGTPSEQDGQISTIVSIGPANTEILAGLGFAGNIIATDTFSANVPGIAPGISQIDMMALDLEHIIALNPCIVIATDMIRHPGNPYPLTVVESVGIQVVFVPVSDSINGIRADIRMLANLLDAEEAGEAIVATMDAEISSIAQIGATITNRRTVYFELYPPPFMTSFGQGTFLQEMLEIIGIDNIFADQGAWVSVADEIILQRNPDVILTSMDTLPDPIGDITSRPGWGVITAVQNGDVFLIYADSSNRPSHNIVYALRQIASAVYPEYFE